MNINNYIIADQIFKVVFSEKFIIYKSLPFIVNYNINSLSFPIINIEINVDPSINQNNINLNNLCTIGEKVNGTHKVYLYNNNHKVEHLINSSYDWKNISILSSMTQNLPFEGCVGEVIFKTVILFNKGFVIHASAIEVDGKGIAFSAPSGTGKSTQADLWVTHKNAKIINADRPAIRIFDDEIRIYGTPWSGTSKQYLNMSAPLVAIFMLEQSPTNKIIELSSLEALRRITARCYLPYFDEELMSLALDNIGAVIQKTPVYLLKCRPDSEAVDVVASCLGL